MRNACVFSLVFVWCNIFQNRLMRNARVFSLVFVWCNIFQNRLMRNACVFSLIFVWCNIFQNRLMRNACVFSLVFMWCNIFKNGLMRSPCVAYKKKQTPKSLSHTQSSRKGTCSIPSFFVRFPLIKTLIILSRSPSAFSRYMADYETQQERNRHCQACV